MTYPKPVEPEKKPQVEIEKEIVSVEEPAVTIDLESKGEIKPEPEPKSDERLVKERDRLGYENRYLKRELDQIKQALQELRQPKEVVREAQPDELDKLAEQDWKAAVRKLAVEEAKEMLKQEREVEQKQKIAEMTQFTFQRSQAEALKLIPELADESSPEAQVYLQVLNENPDLISNPRGPEFVARMTRDRLASNEAPNGDKQELERLKRISAGQAAMGRTVSSGNRIVLTQTEKDLCDRNGIAYESYARNKKLGMAGFKEGVSADE